MSPLTTDEAGTVLDGLKFWPFGDAHEGTFHIVDDRLVMAKMGFDSRAWQFGDDGGDDAELYDQNTSLDNLHTQEFSININDDDLDDRESLLRRVATLTAYAMAHEGLEWLRDADGNMIYDPHTLSDVQVVIE